MKTVRNFKTRVFNIIYPFDPYYDVNSAPYYVDYL